jgi:hypothetical protein
MVCSCSGSAAKNVAKMLGAPATDCTTEEHRAVASRPLPPHDQHQAAP